MNTNETVPRKRKVFNLVVISLTIITLLIIFIIPKGPEEPEKITVDKAWPFAKEFVKNKLVSPSTADFPSYPDRGGMADETTAILEGYVDSQNAFGAVIRTRFQITLRHTGGDWADRRNWQELDFKLIE